MLNLNPINTAPLNSWGIPWTASQGVLTLNWLDISSGDIITSNIQDSPEVDLTWYNNPQNHWMGLLSYFKRARTISMTVFVKWSNETNFLKNLDSFRKACFTKNATLDWKRDGVIRRIKVNCTSNPQVFEHYNVNFARFNITFTSFDPFWYKIDYQSTSISGKSATFQEEITNQGTAQSDVKAYILFWSTNTTEVKLKINEDEITVTHSFSDNDILLIDWENKRVYVWETSVDYSGIFPYMWNWSNFFTFTIDGTFTCDALVINRKNYV